MFDRVGGAWFFERLVGTFYAAVAGDELLAPLYPEAPDFSGATHRLTMFLVQYWGGPTTYSDQRGHPRLRMRHLGFRVGTAERDHWLAHMTHAVDATTRLLVDRGIADRAAADEIAGELMAYFTPSAEHLRNDTGLPITSPSFRS
jgi:hemoglobin